MTQKAFCVDLGRCVGCNACRVACIELRQLPAGVHRRTVHELGEDLVDVPLRNYLSASCNHCDNPPCVENCPVSAYTKREEDGIVVQDHELCIGCKTCIEVCPFGAPCFDEEEGKTQKCDMCFQYQLAGEEPRCVKSCPLSAIQICEVDAIPEGYVQGVEGYPSVTETGANIYVKLPAGVEQVRL